MPVLAPPSTVLRPRIGTVTSVPSAALWVSGFGYRATANRFLLGPACGGGFGVALVRAIDRDLHFLLAVVANAVGSGCVKASVQELIDGHPAVLVLNAVAPGADLH